MYSDHLKGLNHNIANIAKSILLANKLQVNIKPEQRQFDEYGDVIRNYKEELRLAYEDEQVNLLTQVNSEFFNTMNFHLTQRASKAEQTEQTAVVNVLKSLPSSKVVVQLTAREQIKKFLKLQWNYLTNHTHFRLSKPRY